MTTVTHLPNPAAEPGTSMHVLVNVPGLTYRQLDYWTRCGHVRTVTPSCPGSGQARRYDPADYPMLRRAVALSRTGMHISLVFRLARRDTSELAPGIWVTYALGWL